MVSLRKFNLPVGTIVQDMKYLKNRDFIVIDEPRTSKWGTEIGLKNTYGDKFWDSPEHYARR